MYKIMKTVFNSAVVLQESTPNAKGTEVSLLNVKCYGWSWLGDTSCIGEAPIQYDDKIDPCGNFLGDSNVCLVLVLRKFKLFKKQVIPHCSTQDVVLFRSLLSAELLSSGVEQGSQSLGKWLKGAHHH